MSENGAVRPINQEILGMDAADHLIPQIIPAIGTIMTPAFRAGDRNNDLTFSFAGQTSGRLGIFAAKKNNVERAVIMLLPASAKPDGVLICITHGFAQADGHLAPLNWANPLSPEFVKFALLKHVVSRWGAQTLASRKNYAFMYILRAKASSELGPFARDGKFVVEVLDQIKTLTNDSFSYDKAEAFTFSSGIADFNHFVMATDPHLSFRAVYSIDPSNTLPVAHPSKGAVKQYASGTAAGFSPGFEPMPLARWKNEDFFPRWKSVGEFEYLHNHCMPLYVLHLGLETT